jgi:formylglycine-generating enzyme required for sulfatase activity
MSQPSPTWKRRILIAFFVLGPLGLVPYFFHEKPPNVPDRPEICQHPFCVADMVRIAAGPQTFGAQSTDESAPGYDPEAAPDEAPVRIVDVPTYGLDMHLVTVAEYGDCVEHCGCDAGAVARGGYMNYGAVGREYHPMNGVSWHEARAYCKWIGARLPTEAEWERAARGPQGLRFPWGNQPPTCDSRGDGTAHEACPHDGTRPVGDQTADSPFGVRGLAGGVWEWTQTAYGADGSTRVQKGGGWDSDDMMERRAAFRGGLPPETRLADVGFRCACDEDRLPGETSHQDAATSQCHSPSR